MVSNLKIWHHSWNCFYKRAFELSDLWRAWVLERMSGRLNVLLFISLCLEFEICVNIRGRFESFDLTLEYQGLTFIFATICNRMFSNSENCKHYHLFSQVYEQSMWLYENFTLMIVYHLLPFLIRLLEYPYIIGLAIALHIPIKWHAKTIIVTCDISLPSASG